MEKEKALATFYSVHDPLTIPPGPEGTLRSITVYAGLIDQQDDTQPKYHQGITYICLGSSSQPAITPVGHTTPIIIVTTHKVCPKKENAKEEALYFLKDVVRGRGDKKLAAVRLILAKQKGKVRMKVAKGTEWDLQTGAIEAIQQNGAELNVRLRTQSKPIRSEWRHWPNVWIQWTQKTMSEDYWLAIAAPTEEAAAEVRTWLWDEQKHSKKVKPTKMSAAFARLKKGAGERRENGKAMIIRPPTDPRQPERSIKGLPEFIEMPERDGDESVGLDQEMPHIAHEDPPPNRQ